MKEKRLIAMLISSIVVFVASITISLGVAFALADPVAAIGLEEISYKVSSFETTSKQINFDPAGVFNGDISEKVHVYSYDNIEFDDEAAAGQIKLLKVEITNDQSKKARFALRIDIAGATDADGNVDAAYKYAKFAAIRVDTQDVYHYSTYVVSNNNKYALTDEMEIPAGSTYQFVVAAYISDDGRFEAINLEKYMTMTVSVVPINV